MKKLVTIALLCAMLLSCFAGCAMQKGEIYVADAANVQEVADGDKAPTTVPTENISKWTGGNISNGNTQVKIGTDGKVTCTVTGADISWFNPKEKNHVLEDAADFVGFLVLRLVGSEKTFKANYKAFTGKELNYFEGHTFTLKANIDLNGKNIQNYNSAYMFGGTFDGGNHALFNYTMTGVTSGSKGFFSKLTGSACFKNFSLLNGTVDVSGAADVSKDEDSDGVKDGVFAISNGAKSIFGVAVGVVETVSGKTITVSNIYTKCEVTSQTSTTKDIFNKVSGVIGQVTGKGIANIENCASASTLTLTGKGLTVTEINTSTGEVLKTETSYYGQYTGGVISTIESSVTATVKNCSFSGKIDSANTHAAGIIASISSTGAVVVENCVNSGDIKSTSTTVSGIVAAASKTSKLTITSCSSTADAFLSGTSQVSGIISNVSTLANVEIKGCTVASTIETTTISGGLIAYLIDCTKVVVEDCSFSGSFKGDRSSGGIIGFYDNDHNKVTAPTFVVDNCDVTADAILNFEITSANSSVGGIVGRVRGAAFEMKDCEFKGKMTTTFTLADTDKNIQRMAAGGLVGILFDENYANEQAPVASASITNCSVTGTLRFLDNTNTPCVGAIYVGNVANFEGETTTVTYSGLSCTGVTVDTSATKEDEKGTPMKAAQNGNGPVVVGYQLTPARIPEGAEEGAEASKYDIRYVAVFNDAEDIEAVGFKVTLIYKDADGNKVVKVQDQIVYAENVYKVIKGGEAKCNIDTDGNGKADTVVTRPLSYTAESLMGDYIYTLEIKGVDVAYTTAANTLEVLLTPFTATDADNINYGMTADHGKIVIEEPAA